MRSKYLGEMGVAARYSAYAHEATARAYRHMGDNRQQEMYFSLAKMSHKLADDYEKMASDWAKERKVDE